MYPIICKKKKSKKMKSKIYPPVCFAPVTIDGMLPSKVIQPQVVLVDDDSEEDILVDGRVHQELPFSQAAQNEEKFQAQPFENPTLNPKVSNQRAQKHWQTTNLFSKDPIEEFHEEEPVESQSVSMVASIKSSYQNPKSAYEANKVKLNSKSCFKFTSSEIKIPFVNHNQQYGTRECIDVRTMHNPIEVSQPCYQSPCVNQTQVVYPYIKPTPKYTGNKGPAMTFDIHNCMQTTQLRLIHENIKLSKENETLKKNAEVDQKIIMMLRSNIQTLNYILSKKPYKQQQISSDLELFQSQQDYGQ
jgi:hypothetical protein